MYRVWDNENNRYWENLDWEDLVMHQNEDLEILSNDNWTDTIFERKTQTRFKIEKYFCNLDGIYYYEGDIVIVRSYLDSSIKPYKASIVWDNHRFAFKLMDDTVDYASTFGINLRLVGNVNVSEEEDED